MKWARGRGGCASILVRYDVGPSSPYMVGGGVNERIFIIPWKKENRCLQTNKNTVQIEMKGMVCVGYWGLVVS